MLGLNIVIRDTVHHDLIKFIKKKLLAASMYFRT